MSAINNHTLRIRLISCVGVEPDLPLLPHFLKHYSELGIPPQNMHLILHARDKDSDDLREAHRILEDYQIKAVETWIAPYTSDAMWAKRREVQERVSEPGDWIISADVDEFHDYPGRLQEILRHCDDTGVNCVQGVFIDRLSRTGELVDVVSHVPPEKRFPMKADVICTIGKNGRHHDWYGTVKIMACKSSVFPSRGGHHPKYGETPVYFLLGRPLAKFPAIGSAWFRFLIPFRVDHYKWHAALVPGLRRRLASPGVSPAGKEYGQKLLDYFDQHGRIRLSDIPRKRFSPLDMLPWQTRVRLIHRITHFPARLSALRQRLLLRPQ